MSAPLRVIQWTTGNIGRRSLHAILGRDDLELVGVYAHGRTRSARTRQCSATGPSPPAYSPPTTSMRWSRCGRTPCCYNPLWPNIDQLVTLLESGINVCTSAAWITGGKQTQEDLARIEKACEQGESTIFGSGAHPGMTNLVAMVLSGSCERVDEIRITESVDCSTYESAGTQRAMGFAQDPNTPGLAESVRRESEVFAESAAMMADAIGVRLDRMTFDVTFTEATGDSDLGFMTIPAGTIGGVMGYHRGWVGDRNVVSVGFNWTMGSHVVPPKPLAHGHVIQVFGLPEHAHRDPLPATGGLDRGGLHGPRHDLHRDAGHQRRTRRGRGRARHRHPQGPPADHRPRIAIVRRVRHPFSIPKGCLGRRTTPRPIPRREPRVGAGR